MKREEREELKKWIDCSKYGNHHQNTTEYYRQHPHYVFTGTDDSWIMLLGIVFTIGFLTLITLTCFAMKTM